MSGEAAYQMTCAPGTKSPLWIHTACASKASMQQAVFYNEDCIVYDMEDSDQCRREDCQLEV